MKRLIAALLPLLILAGCAAPVGPDAAPPAGVKPETVSPAGVEPEAVSPVYTDWSKLTPYEPPQAVYTLHAGYRADGAFEPRGDYGALLPYIGRYSTMERYVIDYLPLFGLVTDTGELVSDAVYTGARFFDGFLLLYRETSGGTLSCTLTAADGRWARELGDSRYVNSGCGLLMTVTSGGLDLWNTNGEAVAHFDGALFTSRFGEELNWGGEGGPFVDWVDDKLGYGTTYLIGGEFQDDGIPFYLDFSSGAVTDVPPEGCAPEIDYSAIAGDAPEPPAVEGCNYLDPITDPVTGETYFYGYYRDGEDGEGRYALFDGAGRLLIENCELTRFEQSVIVRAGLCSTVEDGCFCFRSLAGGALVFRYPMRTNSD